MTSLGLLKTYNACVRERRFYLWRTVKETLQEITRKISRDLFLLPVASGFTVDCRELYCTPYSFGGMVVVLTFKSEWLRAHRKWQPFGGNRDIIVAFPLSRGLRTDIQDHRVRERRGGGGGLSISRVEKEKKKRGFRGRKCFHSEGEPYIILKSCHRRVC